MADDSKMQIMRQVQQEAAMQNARMLVEVFHSPHAFIEIHAAPFMMLTDALETQ